MAGRKTTGRTTAQVADSVEVPEAAVGGGDVASGVVISIPESRGEVVAKVIVGNSVLRDGRFWLVLWENGEVTWRRA